MKTIFVSFENYQELHELTLLVKAIKEDHSDWVFILFDTTPIYQLNRKDLKTYLSIYNLVIKGKNTFKTSFKKLSTPKKLYITFLNTLHILKIFKVYQVDMMITGVPLAFFRYASFLNRNVFNMAYMRALIIGHDIDHSLSNRLDRKVKKIPFLKNVPIFDSWYCDFLVTVSNVNCQYYLDRGMDIDKIKISGSILLDDIKNKLEPLEDDSLELIFLTYAAAYHDNEESHFEQISVIKKLIALQEIYNFNLTIRVHPRDNANDYNTLFNNNKTVKIDTSRMDDFLRTCSKNKVVISAFSTLNFEWGYLGGRGYFYTTDKLYKTYGNFYRTLDIEPYFDIKKMINHIYDDKPQQYNQNVYKEHQSGNITYLKTLIYKELLDA